jgi:hypothetical protein
MAEEKRGIALRRAEEKRGIALRRDSVEDLA